MLLQFPKRVASRLRLEVSRAWNGSVAAVRRNGIDAYWCDCHNFGDQITPLLLRYYGFTPFHALQNRSRIAATGSILEHLPESFSGIILGSGFLHETSRRSFPNATILAVRGKLTLERLGRATTHVVLGDPGLLGARIMHKREEKRFELGFIPHYVDKNNPSIQAIWKRNHPNVDIIDVECKRSLDVFRRIDKCQSIISSSLHGLILADSLGIPNLWMFSNGLEGGRFKFDDYYSSLSLSSLTPIEISGDDTVSKLMKMTTLKPQEEIEHLKSSLHAVFLGLSRRHLNETKLKPSETS